MKPVSPALLERLHELSLVDVDALAPGGDAGLIAAHVADLEEALAQARRVLRDADGELGAGPDPLLLVEQSPERRVAAGESALLEAESKLVGRAAARRDMARLEEMVVKVLPRLLLADRRLVSVRPS
jgi:hypothetical protein